MNNLLVHSAKGTPISIFSAAELASWQAQQSSTTQLFVKTAQLQSQKNILIPNADSGEVERVIVIAEDDDFWLLGDLAKQLPKGTYFIDIASEQVESHAIAFLLGAYQFSAYKELPAIVAKLAIEDADIYAKVKAAVESINLARDLVNTPAADMMPQHMAEVMEELAEQYGASFEQIIGDELLEQNYPTIHMVGRASDNAPRLLDLRWGNENHAKLTLVGKGVCFDSGGLDLKPASGMRNMKKRHGRSGSCYRVGQYDYGGKTACKITRTYPSGRKCGFSQCL